MHHISKNCALKFVQDDEDECIHDTFSTFHLLEIYIVKEQ